MKVIFLIHFNTFYGQELMIAGSFGVAPMRYVDGFWRFELDLKTAAPLSYSYLTKSGKEITYEAGGPRLFTPSGGDKYILIDQWRTRDNNSPFTSDPFSKVLAAESSTVFHDGNIIFSVNAINLNRKSKVLICGNCDELGNWDPDKAPEMVQKEDGRCYYFSDKTRLPDTVEYKYISIDKIEDSALWEECNNRVVNISETNNNATIILNDFSASLRVPQVKIAGTAIPVFSVRSEKDCGIGDFEGLKAFIDFLSNTSQHVLQILPINDTSINGSRKDSYPYGAISVFALNPMYIHLESVGVIKDREFRERHLKKFKKLNASEEIKYEEVYRVKWAYLRKIFSEVGDKTFKTKDYKAFYKKNEDWLLSYAFFCFLKDKHKCADFNKWPRYSVYSKKDAESFLDNENKYKKELTIHFFVQYHLDKQMKEVRNHAQKKRVILKGDLPIGVNRCSADAWTHPSLFNFDVSSGAPPDNFSENGQNWGFPTYRWEIMEHDGFAWWKKRLQKMNEYFDACRIDHILGFFRIWEIPGKESLMGYFNPSLPLSKDEISDFGIKYHQQYTGNLFIRDINDNNKFHPTIAAHKCKEYKQMSNSLKESFNALYNHYFFSRHEQLWRNTALKRLQVIISSSNMLICGEDLGMIPACVSYVMHELKILTLEVQRMPKNSGESIGNPLLYPYLSVCTTGTHDTSTLRMWLNDSSPKKCRQIIDLHLNSGSMITVLPYQDWISMFEELRIENPESERINDPSDPDNYWGYRMAISIETLIQQKRVISEIKEMVVKSGRAL